jgi:hypothetical protein
MNETDDRTAEVQELTWAMIDQQAADSDVERLEKLLLDNAEARNVYVSCLHMHVDLQCLFGDKRLPSPKLPPKPKNSLPPLDMPLMCSDVPVVNGFLP